MADAWDSWGTSADNDVSPTGWDTDVILTTANIGANPDETSSYGMLTNKSTYARHNSPTASRGRNSYADRNNTNRNERPNNRRDVNNDQHEYGAERNKGYRNENTRGGRSEYTRGGRNENTRGGRNEYTRGGRNHAGNNFDSNGPRYYNRDRSNSQSSGPTQQNSQRSMRLEDQRRNENNRPHVNDFNKHEHNKFQSKNSGPFNFQKEFSHGSDNNRDGNKRHEYPRPPNDPNRENTNSFYHNRDPQNNDNKPVQDRYDNRNRGPEKSANKYHRNNNIVSENFGFQNKFQGKNDHDGNRKNERSHNEPSKNFNPSKRGSDDFGGNNRRDKDNQNDHKAPEFYEPKNSKSGSSQKKRENNKGEKEEIVVQDFDEPPQLFSVESKPTVLDNDLDESVSSKISTKSESVTSSDPHEIETKILNMIHEFKTTLHVVDTKPSRLVQNEIKGLKKYIGLILEKWNPKSKQGDSSSDSESSDSSSSEDTKKRKKRNKKRKKNKNKEIQKEGDKTVANTEGDSNETSINNQRNDKIPSLMDNNVKQFQENSANFLNQQPMGNMGIHQQPTSNMGMRQQPMPMPGPPLMYPHPSMMIPPFPIPLQDNRYWQMQQKLGSPLMNMNQTNTQAGQPKAPVKPHASQVEPSNPTNYPYPSITSKSKNNQPVPNNKSVVNKDMKLSNEVLSIVNDIKISGVTMSKADIEELRVALGKITVTDKSNLTSTDHWKEFNVCMVKIVENDTLPIDVKYNIFHQLETFFNNTCDENSRSSLKKLLNIYDKALKEKKSLTTEFNQKDETNYEFLKKVSNDSNIFFFPKKVNELFEFKEEAREAMVTHNEHSTATRVVDTPTTADNMSETEESGDDSCEDNDEETGDEDNEDKGKKEIIDTKEKKIKSKRIAHKTFIEELGIHCKSFLSSEQSMEEQVNNLLATYEQVQFAERKTQERKLMYLIKDLVKKFYPGCILHLFGSRLSNMALPDSDMDIYIDATGKGYCNSATYENQKLFVKKLRKVFYQRPDCFSRILALTRTTVPIIKLHHNASAINCDINFKSGISVENTKLLSYYLSIDPRVKWLTTAVKLWAQYNHIYGSDYFTSHGLCWLVLFYLMHLSIVPPVSRLKQGVQPRVIDNWDISFKKLDDWSPAVPPTSRLTLFKDFFSFLREPLLKNTVLCTFTGEFIPKETIMNPDALEKYQDGIFKDYVARIRRNNQTDELFSKENPSSMPMKIQEEQLCIQDPFEFSKNVSNAVREKKFAHFMTVCRLTLQQLEFCK